MNGGNKPLKYALLYGEAGYLVFPCRPGSKMPATRHGLLDASTEVDEIQQMFDDPDFNIGLACGLQPNGRNLLAVDVDAHKGGLESWFHLTMARPVVAPMHETPNGGMHVFFDAPSEFRNSRERLGQGIDTRASGGYVVVPPSSLFPVDDGEDRPYRATGATALLTNVPPPVPDWLLALLEPEVDAEQGAEADVLRGPRPGGDEWESPADWIRRVGDWAAELGRFGWSHAHGSYWVRPGKSARDGHSAVLHEGGPLVVFSTDVPVELESVGHRTADGTGFSVSLFELIAAYEFGGDLSACAREFRRSMPTVGVGHGQGSAPTVDAAPGGVRAEVVSSVLNLPAEFWEARPILTQIYQAAQAQLCGPDALLVNVLARSAALIPPSLRLPAAVGSSATFDFLACVVAESSGGKSMANDVARDLVPDPGWELRDEERVYMFDRPVGSGEGIAQAFMVAERQPDDKGALKLTGKQVVGRQALHLVVDEATALMSQAQRRGTTIIPTLLTAWSGKTLGNQNASAETLRVIDGGRVRVAAVLNMQSSNAHLLLTDELTTLGLTSRTLFAEALDPTVPDEDEEPDWPGRLEFPVPAKMGVFEYMAYDQAITREIRSERRAVLKGGVTNISAGHSYLLRCKVASILAVWDGRRDVDLVDWALAEMVMDASAAVLTMLQKLSSQRSSDQRNSQAKARGEAEYVASEAKKSKQITDLSLKLVNKVPPEGIGRAQLRKGGSGASRRIFDDALAQAVNEGRLTVVDGRVERAK